MRRSIPYSFAAHVGSSSGYRKFSHNGGRGENRHMQQFVTFNNGQQYPILGMGTWQTKTFLADFEQEEIYEAIKKAIDIGYRHFDCATYYNNEKSVGKAISDKIKEGVIKREDVYVTSKVWNDKHKPEDMEKSLNNTLKDMGFDYLDLYLIHWPVSATLEKDCFFEPQYKDANVSYLETWKAMEKSVQLGLVKSIGISNFNIKQVENILKIATIKPVVNQVENHPYLTQNKLKKFCEANGILITAYGPLGSPYRDIESDEVFLLDEPVLKLLSDKYKKSKAQLLIRFQIQRGVMVIPKSSNAARLKENFDVWDFKMKKEEIGLLESLNKNHRYVRFKPVMHCKEYPFK